jgi:hypothetical protein
MAEKIKTNIYFDPAMLRGLKKLGELRGEPYAQIVRDACREYIVRHAEKIARDAKAARAI